MRKTSFSFDRILRLATFALGLMSLIVASAPYFASEKLGKLGLMRPTPEVITVKEMVPVVPPADTAPHAPILTFDRDTILDDTNRRISDSFVIPPGLEERVGFWFDVYSKYDSNQRVIHHSLYPWIVYKVVDVEPIINATYPKFRWQRNQIADGLVKQELAKVRKAVRSLAAKRKRSQLEDSKLTPDEINARDALAQLKGDVRRRAKEASREVRVQMGQRNFFAEGLQISARYLPGMEEIFAQHRLPIELTRLPLVESSFNKRAESKVGAAGIWQFMPSTGKRQKLVINEDIDERKSPYKATEAAAKLLKENHLILGRSWALALTAWNHGPAGVKKASRAAGTRDLSRIIEVYHSRSFDFASENFFSEFLAALYVERYADKVFPSLPREAPLSVQQVRLTRKIKVNEILRVAAITAEEFSSINPEMTKLIRRNSTIPKGMRIHVPADARSAIEFLMAEERERAKTIGANG